MIFKIFIFCMFVILGVLIFGIIRWFFKYLKLCYLHIDWKIKILLNFKFNCQIILFIREIIQIIISVGDQ